MKFPVNKSCETKKQPSNQTMQTILLYLDILFKHLSKNTFAIRRTGKKKSKSEVSKGHLLSCISVLQNQNICKRKSVRALKIVYNHL